MQGIETPINLWRVVCLARGIPWSGGGEAAPGGCAAGPPHYIFGDRSSTQVSAAVAGCSSIMGVVLGLGHDAETAHQRGTTSDGGENSKTDGADYDFEQDADDMDEILLGALRAARDDLARCSGGGSGANGGSEDTPGDRCSGRTYHTGDFDGIHNAAARAVSDVVPPTVPTGGRSEWVSQLGLLSPSSDGDSEGSREPDLGDDQDYYDGGHGGGGDWAAAAATAVPPETAGEHRDGNVGIGVGEYVEAMDSDTLSLFADLFDLPWA